MLAVAVGPVKKGDSQLKEPQRWKAFSENKSHLDQIDENSGNYDLTMLNISWEYHGKLLGGS